MMRSRIGKAKLQGVFVVVVTVMVGAFLLAGCTSGSTPAGAAGSLRIENAYSRPAPAGGMGGAFLTVVNPGSTPDRLIGARTPIAQAVELHETFDDNGVMKMRPVPGGYEVPANGKLELKPGGYHLMFVGLSSPLMLDQEVEITLSFEKAGDVTIKAPVRQ